MVSSNNAINKTVGATISGVTNTFTVTNPSNTASSAARETITVGGGTAADPTLNFNVSGVTDWEMGIDNSSSDNLTISQGTALGTNDVWKMTVAGERTMPLQPAFLAYLAATDNNVTGDNTTFTLGSATALTEVFDQNADFNTNGTFTSPVTARYYLGLQMTAGNLSASFTECVIRVVTSNRSYQCTAISPGAVRNDTNNYVPTGIVFADMDAADTATFDIRIAGGTKTISIVGGATAFTIVYGSLEC